MTSAAAMKQARAAAANQRRCASVWRRRRFRPPLSNEFTWADRLDGEEVGLAVCHRRRGTRRARAEIAAATRSCRSVPPPRPGCRGHSPQIFRPSTDPLDSADDQLPTDRQFYASSRDGLRCSRCRICHHAEEEARQVETCGPSSTRPPTSPLRESWAAACTELAAALLSVSLTLGRTFRRQVARRVGEWPVRPHVSRARRRYADRA